MLIARTNAVFIKVAFFNLHPTLLTCLAASTDTLNFHTQMTGGIQHQRAVLDLPAASGGHQDKGVRAVGICVRHVGDKRRQSAK